MEKKWKWKCFPPESMSKILLRMKLLTFFILVSMVTATASSYSQQTKFNLKLNGVTVRQVFQEIEANSEFILLYNEKQLDANRKVDVKVENETVESIMNQVFNGTQNTFKIYDRQIVILETEGKETPSVNKSETFAEQKKEISGKVKDSKGLSIPGVSVLVKGTTTGTVTDNDGQYKLSVGVNVKTLVFSFVGMKSQEITISSKTIVNVEMEEETLGLDEVVAIGYGTANKRTVTGNQSVIKSESLAMIPTSSIDATLQGKATGIDITSGDGGRNNGLVRVRIRGNGSINAGTQPLWVIDGVPMNSDEGGSAGMLHSNYQITSTSVNLLSYLNPNDIETVSVLKDAGATAIYDSRGANGVILVTTKTGKAGKGRIDVEYKRTLSQAINQVKLMDGEQWRNTNTQAWKNDGMDGQYPLPLVNLFMDNLQNGSPALTRDMVNSTSTNWLNKVIRNGMTDDISLSASNGTEKASYFISGNYSSKEGMMIGQESKNLNVRSNIDFQPLKWLKMGTRIAYSTSKGHDALIDQFFAIRGNYTNAGTFGIPSYQNLMRQGLPVYPEKYSDGSPFEPLGGLNVPLMLNDRNRYSQEYHVQHLVGMAYVEIEVLKGLTFRTEAGLDDFNQPYHTYAGGATKGNPNVWATTNFSTEGINHTKKTNFNSVLTYSKIINGIHNISITAGAEETSTVYYYNRYSMWNITSPNHRIGQINYSPNNADLSGLNGISNEYEDRFRGYFGRINYTLADKYLIGSSIRRDGSNKFGPDNRFGVFPSLSAGWIVSNEGFFPKGVISMMKFRASIGQTGNSNIPLDRYKTVFGNYADYNDIQDLSMVTLGNNLIHWEKSTILDAGLEFGLFNNRISGSLAYYNKTTSDMLLNSAPSPSVPAGIDPANRGLITNAGSLTNSGIEISLSSVNIAINEFKWSTDINFSTNANKVNSLDKQYASTPFQISGDERIAIAENHMLGEYTLTKFAGYTENGDDKIYKVDQAQKVASNKYELTALTGETIISTKSNSADNRLFTGKSGIAKFFGSINNSFSYKGISLDVLFTFKGGNYLYLDNTSLTSAGPVNMTSELIDNTWTTSNLNATYPRLSYNGLTYEKTASGTILRQARADAEDRNLIKGDYVRLKDLRLGYNLPKSIIEKIKVKNLMIYLDIQNLLTFSYLKYYDPEMTGSLRGSVVGNGGQNTASAFNYAPSVISNIPFPNARTFTFGLKIGL